MSSHHHKTVKFSNTPNKIKDCLSNIGREMKMGELRLRYVQLMRDAQVSLGNKDADILIKESETMRDKLSNPKTEDN